MKPNFIKTDDKTIVFRSYCYFSIRKYHYTLKQDDILPDCNEILSSFMKTEYFLWEEKFHENFSVSDNGKQKFVEWNFHGLYDINKLSVLSFDVVLFSEFMDRIISCINDNIDDVEYIDKVKDLLYGINSQGNKYYVIKNLPLEYVHEWTVYSFFISGIVCNTFDNTITLIEYGCD